MGWTIIANISVAMVMGVTAVCVAIGMYIAAMTAIGASKKRFQENKQAPMLMLTFIGFPLTELIYAFIIMQQMLAVQITADNVQRIIVFAILSTVIMGGIGIGEGKIGAAACKTLCETDKGVALYIASLGIVETVALFAMVFTITNL